MNWQGVDKNAPAVLGWRIHEILFLLVAQTDSVEASEASQDRLAYSFLEFLR